METCTFWYILQVIPIYWKSNLVVCILRLVHIQLGRLLVFSSLINMGLPSKGLRNYLGDISHGLSAWTFLIRLDVPVTMLLAVPWLRSLVTGLSPRRPGFAPGSIHVGFVVDNVALGQVFLRVLRFSRQYIIPPSLSKLISSGEWVIC
jgi:hypothetical protein